MVAGEITKAAAPDGHTLFLPYHQHTVNAALLKKLPYHPVNDFTPITQLTEAGLLLVTHPGTPAKNFKILNEPDVRKRIQTAGGTPVGSSPEDFRKFLLADMAKWADVVKRSGAKMF